MCLVNFVYVVPQDWYSKWDQGPKEACKLCIWHGCRETSILVGQCDWTLSVGGPAHCHMCGMIREWWIYKGATVFSKFLSPLREITEHTSCTDFDCVGPIPSAEFDSRKLANYLILFRLL